MFQLVWNLYDLHNERTYLCKTTEILVASWSEVNPQKLIHSSWWMLIDCWSKMWIKRFTSFALSFIWHFLYHQTPIISWKARCISFTFNIYTIKYKRHTLFFQIPRCYCVTDSRSIHLFSYTLHLCQLTDLKRQRYTNLYLFPRDY